MYEIACFFLMVCVCPHRLVRRLRQRRCLRRISLWSGRCWSRFGLEWICPKWFCPPLSWSPGHSWINCLTTITMLTSSPSEWAHTSSIGYASHLETVFTVQESTQNQTTPSSLGMCTVELFQSLFDCSHFSHFPQFVLNLVSCTQPHQDKSMCTRAVE